MTISIIAPAAVAAALTLAACGESDFSGATMQVAARVNGNEIYMQQVASALERSDGNSAPQQMRQVTVQALDHLIDQELLVQKALASRIDREPEVVEAIAAERRRILGLAYLDRAVPRAPKRSVEEVRRFFDANPALFEQRRIYETRELAATLPPDKAALLDIQVAHGARLDDVAHWLRGQGLSFQDTTSTRPAEQIPLEMLPRLAEMGDAQIAFFHAGDKVSVVELIGARSAPLSEAQAAPVIERMLGNRWRLELAMNEVKRLRGSARIEYLGPFAAGKTQKAPAPPGRLRLNADGEPIRRGPELL
jgi:EpsD family peptidyl-prolyl cis-trans isomerase